MLAAERRRLIAESIRSRGVVSVAEMADVLGTTEITLRRDLRSMAREGLLVRTHGGAVLPAGLGPQARPKGEGRQAPEEKEPNAPPPARGVGARAPNLPRPPHPPPSP